MNYYSQRARNVTNALAVLPVGSVNVLTGKCKEYTSIFNLWEEDENETYVIFKMTRTVYAKVQGRWESQVKTSFRATITCDKIDNVRVSYPVGSKWVLFHDQSGAQFGDSEWEVVGWVRNTRDDLPQIKTMTGKTSMAFGTFK